MTEALKLQLQETLSVTGEPRPDGDEWVSRTLQVIEQEERDGAAFATLRLIYFRHKSPDAQGVVDNICEQPVCVIPESFMADERLPAFLDALHQALGFSLTDMPGNIFVMPSDLMVAPSSHPLALSRPKTTDDFLNALMARKRLGRWR